MLGFSSSALLALVLNCSSPTFLVSEFCLRPAFPSPSPAGPGHLCRASPAAIGAARPPGAAHLCPRAAGARLICHLQGARARHCINMAMLLREQRVPPRSAAFLQPRAPAWLFMQKLGFLPPHRCCLQKELQLPVVLDRAVAPLGIPALPACPESLLSLIGLKVSCFCLLLLLQL